MRYRLDGMVNTFEHSVSDYMQHEEVILSG